jgi:hypothetical protein
MRILTTDKGKRRLSKPSKMTDKTALPKSLRRRSNKRQTEAIRFWTNYVKKVSVSSMAVDPLLESKAIQTW